MAAALLIAFYIIILTVLLIIQFCTIQGQVPRLAANLTALILVIPGILLVKLYLSALGKEEVPESGEESSGAEAEQEKSSRKKQQDFYDEMKKKGLSPREQEVAWLIYRGYSNLEIAEELYISETTVKKHATHIYEKLEVSGRKELKSAYKPKSGAA